MKLEGVGAVIVRMSAVAFLLKGLAMLAGLAWNYSAMTHMAQTNASLRPALQQSMKAMLSGSLIALGCGAVAWLLSRPMGRLLARGLEQPSPVSPEVIHATD